MKHLHGARAVVLTISDSASRGSRKDESGAVLVAKLKRLGAAVLKKEIVADDLGLIKERFKDYCDRLCADLVLSTGGTGFGPRDVTPEATHAVIAKEAPGLAELMRLESLKKTKRAALSRAVAGVRGRTLIVNLPGSPKAASESFQAIVELIPHALAMIRGEGHRP
jgi:molybdopterin adenylyltransferase